MSSRDSLCMSLPVAIQQKFPRVELLNGKRITQLTRELQGQTVEMPVGTTIFLRFNSGSGVWFLA